MSFFRRLLIRLHLWPEVSLDEHLNASTEDALHEHSETVERFNEETQKRKEQNKRLRRSLHAAQIRTTAFSDVESAFRRKEGLR